MKKILIALSVLATTQMAMAAFTPITKIKSVYTYDNYAIIKTENAHTNADSCTKNVATEYLYLVTNTDGGKAKYSALLSAYVAQKQVRLGYAGCAAWGNGTVPKVYGVSLF